MSEGRSDARLTALYQEVILDHYRRPRNKGTLPTPSARASLRNPICGDEIEVEVALDGDQLSDVRFGGRGCSISQASASMMTGLVRGRTVAEAMALGERVSEMLRGDAAAARDESLGDLRALSGVSRFPSRVPCAMLAWQALGRAVGKAGTGDGTAGTGD